MSFDSLVLSFFMYLYAYVLRLVCSLLVKIACGQFEITEINQFERNKSANVCNDNNYDCDVIYMIQLWTWYDLKSGYQGVW